ncbi:MAG: hypothetical protein JXA10_08185 [Anaerolineae bacterium]|nr:hypothetical protein [Anaerolineae bacterium]
MRETQAIIERIRRVADGVQQIDLAVDAALAQLEPGQSLFAAPFVPPDQITWEPYLRAQWIPVDILPGRVVVEVETRHIGGLYNPGDVVSLLSPVGRPIPLRGKIYHMLLIAEDMLPTPFVYLARKLIGGGVEVTLVMGGRATKYPLELLPPEVEIIHSETDWKWPDQVDTLTWADQVLILAPVQTNFEAYRRLYDAINQLRHQSIPDHYVAGMYYPRLACGSGACLACMISSKKQLLACTDGPAIDLKRLNF